MTGPEHYREAERLLRMAKSRSYDLSSADLDAAGELRTSSEQLAAADVHAKLASAAATVLAATTTATTQRYKDIEAWERAVTGVKPAGEQS